MVDWDPPETKNEGQVHRALHIGHNNREGDLRYLLFYTLNLYCYIAKKCKLFSEAIVHALFSTFSKPKHNAITAQCFIFTQTTPGT